MQAIVFPQAEAMSVERVDDPPCAPDEVIVQVAQCGICGTDVHIYHNEYMSDFPLIPGHEFAGTVVEVGSAVRTIKLGDRVAVDPNLYCGACDFCRNEQANHCSNWQGIGITRGGGCPCGPLATAQGARVSDRHPLDWTACPVGATAEHGPDSYMVRGGAEARLENGDAREGFGGVGVDDGGEG